MSSSFGQRLRRQGKRKPQRQARWMKSTTRESVVPKLLHERRAYRRKKFQEKYPAEKGWNLVVEFMKRDALLKRLPKIINFNQVDAQASQIIFQLSQAPWNLKQNHLRDILGPGQARITNAIARKGLPAPAYDPSVHMNKDKILI